MSTTDYGRPTAFRIGRVFGDSFGVFGRNALLCIGLALIFSGIPTLLLQWVTYSTLLDSASDPTAMSQQGGAVGLIAIVGGLVSFVLGSLLQASLTRASIEDLNGQRPSFGDCLGTALGVVFPVMIIALLVSIGAGLGALLLLVPGIILWLRWSVAIPVQVNERLGILGSMSRSAELTKGSRWSLFGLYLILIIAIIAMQLLAGFAAGLFTSAFGALGAVLAAALISSLWTIALSIVAGVVYVELRLVKEGTDVKDLAEIFA